MKIRINNEPFTFDRAMKIRDVLEHLQLKDRKGIAVAVNLTVVPKSEFDVVEVRDGDAVEIIHAVQGG